LQLPFKDFALQEQEGGVEERCATSVELEEI